MNDGYPFFIAELSGNHHGYFERASALIRAAKDSGADTVKLQTYTPETMVADTRFMIGNGPWAGKNLQDLYAQAMTPWEWHKDLFALCKDLGLSFMSTPFDEKAVDFLESIDCQAYKVASFEITDIPLIRHIAATRKPMMISTGMAKHDEIETAIWNANDVGCHNIHLLKCTSAYPAKPEDANLMTMVDMVKQFSLPVGISDHSKGNAIPIAAAMMGAMVIEKHLTLDDEPGPDSHFSIKPHEYADMVREVKNACDAVGDVRYGPTDSERDSLIFRRSLYILNDMKAGETVTESNCKTRRPNLGITPEAYYTVMGRRLKQDVKGGTPLQWEMLTNENDNLQ